MVVRSRVYSSLRRTSTTTTIVFVLHFIIYIYKWVRAKYVICLHNPPISTKCAARVPLTQPSHPSTRSIQRAHSENKRTAIYILYKRRYRSQTIYHRAYASNIVETLWSIFVCWFASSDGPSDEPRPH